MSKSEIIFNLIQAATESHAACWYCGEDERTFYCAFNTEIITVRIGLSGSEPVHIEAIDVSIRGVDLLYLPYGEAGKALLELTHTAVDDDKGLANARKRAIDDWMRGMDRGHR